MLLLLLGIIFLGVSSLQRLLRVALIESSAGAAAVIFDTQDAMEFVAEGFLGMQEVDSLDIVACLDVTHTYLFLQTLVKEEV